MRGKRENCIRSLENVRLPEKRRLRREVRTLSGGYLSRRGGEVKTAKISWGIDDANN